MKSAPFLLTIIAGFATLTSVHAADLLPNSCALFLKITQPNGTQKLAQCSGVAKDEQTILTGYHCVSPIVDVVKVKPEASSSVPIAIGCGFQGKKSERICEDKGSDLGLLMDCISSNFDYGYVIVGKNFGINRIDMTQAVDFENKYADPVNLTERYLKSYYAAILSLDISAITLTEPLHKFSKDSSPLLEIGVIHGDPETAGYINCRAEGFGNEGEEKHHFLPKSIGYSYGDLTFQSPFANLGIEGGSKKTALTILEKNFGFSQIIAKMKDLRGGDSGSPLYCTKDNVHWDLVAIFTQGDDVFSSFLSPQAARFFKSVGVPKNR